jgi:hypothetical protein
MPPKALPNARAPYRSPKRGDFFYEKLESDDGESNHYNPMQLWLTELSPSFTQRVPLGKRHRRFHAALY